MTSQENDKDYLIVRNFMVKFFKPKNDVYIYFNKALRFLRKNREFELKLAYAFKKLLEKNDEKLLLALINEGTNRNIYELAEARELLYWIYEELGLEDAIDVFELLQEEE